MRKMLLMMLLVICTLSINAQSASNKDATIVSDIQYKSNQDAYVNERCKLDIYYSKGQKDCPVVVWYHGGGLTSGSKQLPSQLINLCFWPLCRWIHHGDAWTGQGMAKSLWGRCQPNCWFDTFQWTNDQSLCLS